MSIPAIVLGTCDTEAVAQAVELLGVDRVHNDSSIKQSINDRPVRYFDRIRGRNGDRNFRGEKRGNETHASTTDPACDCSANPPISPQLCHMGHLLMENRNGLLVDAMLIPATGTAEREAAVAMLGKRPSGGRITARCGQAVRYQRLRGRRASAAGDAPCRPTNGRRSAIDRRTTRHIDYDLSQRIRKRIEESFGWIKTIGGLRKTRHRSTARVGWQFVLTVVAYNLVRIPKLLVP